MVPRLEDHPNFSLTASEVTLGDLPGLMDVERDCFVGKKEGWSEKEMADELINNLEGFNAVRDQERIIAYIQTQVGYDRVVSLMGDSRDGVIGSIAVMQDYRRRGVGRLLLQIGLEQLWRQGVPQIILTTRVSNNGMIRLAKSFGFVEDQVFKKHYQDSDGVFEDGSRMILKHSTLRVE